MIVVKIKDSKTIRIYGENIGSKWNAFTIHARSQGTQQGRLLGEITLITWSKLAWNVIIMLTVNW